jgi:hypothetical protein
VTPNFLRIIPAPFVRKFAPQILAPSKAMWAGWSSGNCTTCLSEKMNCRVKNWTNTWAFLNVALQRTQREVLQIEFQTLLKEAPDRRAVLLTMNMDYMDNAKPPMDFETQLADILNIQRYYAKHVVNFLGIDPRHKSG